MKRYDKYKQTGTPWIGKIPQHWQDSHLKYIGKYINGYAFKPEDWASEGTPIIRIQDLTESNSNPNYFKGLINDKYLIKDGDILVSWAATLAAFKWNGGKAWLNQHIFKAIPNDSVNYDFFFWLLRLAMRNMKNGEEHGIMMEHVTNELFGNFPIPIPPLAEQVAIAGYLDKKCGSIDAVISTQERRIALLEELKQSVITEAVTHGVNPNAILRPSGIDWIGNIPQHWEVMKISHLFKIVGSGTTPSTGESTYYCDAQEHFWLQTGDLNDGHIIDTSKYITDKAVKELNMKEYSKGSIVIAMYGATVGKLGLLDISTSVNQACCVLSNSNLINNMYMFFSLLAARKFLISLSVGGGQPNISQEIIRKHKTPVPPLSEQQEIVAYVDSKIKPIDASIAKAKREIELLKELKQSVITEAVTGKIKVY